MELFPRNQRSPSADSALWFLSTVAPSLATATAYIPSRHRRSSPLSVLCVGDYVGEQGGANYSAKFKNLEKLVKSLDTEILAKLHGSSKPFRSYILLNKAKHVQLYSSLAWNSLFWPFSISQHVLS
ncbi:hypothetical protein ACOSQ4_030796 [Xanthoceras sorbifolium]